MKLFRKFLSHQIAETRIENVINLGPKLHEYRTQCSLTGIPSERLRIDHKSPKCFRQPNVIWIDLQPDFLPINWYG